MTRLCTISLTHVNVTTKAGLDVPFEQLQASDRHDESNPDMSDKVDSPGSTWRIDEISQSHSMRDENIPYTIGQSWRIEVVRYEIEITEAT